MATNAMVLTSWGVEYYQTMAAAEKARREMQKAIAAEQARRRAVRLVAPFILYLPFKAVTGETEKLIGVLREFEKRPASILLEDEAVKIPASLRELFQKMCDVLQKSNAEGLDTTRVLSGQVKLLGRLSQEIAGFADRYEDAQNKLRSRVSPADVALYADSFDAYRKTVLQVEEATDEDVKTVIPL